MKKFLLVLALLFPLASFSQSPVDKSFPPEELFALGSYYYPEQWDSSQWERDLKRMAEIGIKFTYFAEFAWAIKSVIKRSISLSSPSPEGEQAKRISPKRAQDIRFLIFIFLVIGLFIFVV